MAYIYPAVSNSGKVFISVGQAKGRLLIMRFDPAWLYESRQETRFSTGLDDWSIFGTKDAGLVAHPTDPGAQVLSIRKIDADRPAAAVWNFPMGERGRLRLRLT